jgi:hypothetical protein
LTPAEELRLVRGGGPPEAAGADLDTVRSDCAGDPERAAARVREVLGAVFERALAAGDDWPGPEEWRNALPDWFVAACVDDLELRDCVIDRWSLRAWTYWFQPDLRKWRWWDASAGDGCLAVRVLVLDRPYLRGSLEWLLKVACRA